MSTGKQEDVELLVAIEGGGNTHLLLIDAKGWTGWTNKQLLSEAERLERIFGTDGAKYPQVKPYFDLMSPRLPRRIESNFWPVWMTRDGEPIWFELKLPGGRRKVTRCDSTGNASAKGAYFRALNR